MPFPKLSIGYITLSFVIALALSRCGSVHQITDHLPIPTALNEVDVSGLVKQPDPITTSFADTKEDKSLPANFGNNKKPLSLSRQPRSAGGGYLLAPGLYEMTCKSYCLHAGTHGPSNGDGYLYAPLKGSKSDIIQAIVRNAAIKPAIPQTMVQTLIWAVLARTSFKNLSTELQAASIQLLNPQQLYALNGGALGLIPQSAIDKAGAGLPPLARQTFEAGNRLRGLFQKAGTTYQEFERVAVLAGLAPGGGTFASGIWSRCPEGYYVRYYPNSYRMTRVQVYVPAKPVVDYRQNESLFHLAGYRYEDDYFDNRVEYDATKNVAVPANTGAQRLMQSNEDANKRPTDSPTNPTTPDNKPDFDPCDFPAEARINVGESEADFEARRRLPADQRKEKSKSAQEIQDLVRKAGIKPNVSRFETVDEAGIAAVRYINGTSIAVNREYAGQIYKNPKDGMFYFSDPVQGQQGHSKPTASVVPKGMEVVGDYHTHGGDFKYSDEVFSGPEIGPDGITSGDRGAALEKHDGLAHYLGTPQGKLERMIVPKDYSDKNIIPCKDMIKVF